MAFVPTNPTFTTAAWTLVATGPGEFNWLVDQRYEWLVAATLPTTLRGNPEAANTKVPVNLPSGANLYSRVPYVSGTATGVLTPGQ